MQRLTNYFRDTAAELKQVNWPTQHQALLYTILVIVISALVALFLGVFDFVFSEFIKAIVERF